MDNNTFRWACWEKIFIGDDWTEISTLEENKIPSCPHPCLSALLRGFHRRTRRGKMRKSSGEDFWKTGSYYFSESEILSFWEEKFCKQTGLDVVDKSDFLDTSSFNFLFLFTCEMSFCSSLISAMFLLVSSQLMKRWRKTPKTTERRMNTTTNSQLPRQALQHRLQNGFFSFIFCLCIRKFCSFGVGDLSSLCLVKWWS